jgi:hypothetical protein
MTQTHARFLLYAGDTLEIDASLHDADGTALNLANADEIEWNLRNASQQVVASLRLSGGVEITNALSGKCRITLPPMQTNVLPVGTYYDEIRATMSDGTISTQAVGEIAVERAGAPNAVSNLLSELEALKATRRSGIARTRMEGFEVEYKPDSEMAGAISATEREINSATKPRNITVRATKGW